MTKQQFIVYLQTAIDRIDNMSYYDKTERVFCYELYHQMKILKDNLHGMNIIDNDALRFHQYFQRDGTDQLIISSEISKENTIYPDFVFHNDAWGNNNDSSCQFAVIEVKLSGSPNADVKHDIIKLYNMITGGLNYQIGVILYIGSRKGSFIRKIRTILMEADMIHIRNFLQEDNQRMYFVFRSFKPFRNTVSISMNELML